MGSRFYSRALIQKAGRLHENLPEWSCRPAFCIRTGLQDFPGRSPGGFVSEDGPAGWHRPPISIKMRLLGVKNLWPQKNGSLVYVNYSSSHAPEALTFISEWGVYFRLFSHPQWPRATLTIKLKGWSISISLERGGLFSHE